MTIQIIVLVLGLVALGYAWYTERTRRREAELERDLATRRTTLDGIQKKLDEGKTAYDNAKADFNGAAPIPPDMLQYLGMDQAKPDTAVADVRSGRLVDPQTGAVVGEPERFHRPGLDGISPKGKAPATH